MQRLVQQVQLQTPQLLEQSDLLVSFTPLVKFQSQLIHLCLAVNLHRKLVCVQ